MDSNSDFEAFPSSQISFCGFNQSQSMEYGRNVIDSDDNGDENVVVSLENNENIVDNIHGVGQGASARRVIYDNVEIEDISSDEEIDKL